MAQTASGISPLFQQDRMGRRRPVADDEPVRCVQDLRPSGRGARRRVRDAAALTRPTPWPQGRPRWPAKVGNLRSETEIGAGRSFPCRREGPSTGAFSKAPARRIVGHAGVQAVSGIATWRCRRIGLEGQPRKTTFWRFPARSAVDVRVNHPPLRDGQCCVLRRAAGPKTARAVNTRTTIVHPRPHHRDAYPPRSAPPSTPCSRPTAMLPRCCATANRRGMPTASTNCRSAIAPKATNAKGIMMILDEPLLITYTPPSGTSTPLRLIDVAPAAWSHWGVCFTFKRPKGGIVKLDMTFNDLMRMAASASEVIENRDHISTLKPDSQ